MPAQPAPADEPEGTGRRALTWLRLLKLLLSIVLLVIGILEALTRLGAA